MAGWTHPPAALPGARCVNAGLQPTAVICSNDLIAAGVIIECQAQGLRVPR